MRCVSKMCSLSTTVPFAGSSTCTASILVCTPRQKVSLQILQLLKWSGASDRVFLLEVVRFVPLFIFGTRIFTCVTFACLNSPTD